MNLPLLIGIIGMIMVCVGALLPVSLAQKVLFLVGSAGLATTAICERHRFLIALEAVILLGTSLAFFVMTPMTTAIIMLVASVICLTYLYRKGDISSFNSWLGALALLTLAVGFAYSHPLIYLSGGVLMCAYSIGLLRQGIKIAMLWLILNLVFVAVTLFGLLQLT